MILQEGQRRKFMRKNIYVFIIAGIMALSLCGCGEQKEENLVNIEHVDTEKEDAGAEDTEEPYTEASDMEPGTEEGKDTLDEESNLEFSFADLKGLEFWFCSGAGGWATILTIGEDGSFSGQWFDGDMGMTGEDYPNGTMSLCDFKGQFTQPVKENDYTYSVQISELNYAKEVGTEEIKDGVLYCYGTAYGLDDAEDILIYLPGTPLKELSEDFRSWVGYYDLSGTTDTELPFYALHNEASGYGFYSQDMIEDMQQSVSSAEEWAASIEKSIQEDALTQAELNEKAEQLYEVWDSALNTVWSTLKKTQDEKAMSRLTEEEREWIARKEQKVAEAGAEYEGGSMQPMVMNQKAAELTKDRVYELIELFEDPEGKKAGSKEVPENQIDYSGKYTDKQGTTDIYSELDLKLSNDGTYDVSVGLYRLTTLEGTASYENGKLHFLCEEPFVEGEITIDGDKAELTITDSAFEYIHAGDAFSFLDGKVL